MSDPAKWADLRTRLLSAMVVLVLGFGSIWAGGLALRLLALASAGLMLWELARLLAPARPQAALAIGALAAGSLAVILLDHGPYWLALLVAPSAWAVTMPRGSRLIFAGYGFAIMLAAYAFVAFREGYGLGFVLWFVLVVIASDVMGYFGGRLLGGPKFWPRVSPKKTWSGTVAGWAGAGLVGAVFGFCAGLPLAIIPFSALTAFAAQMGDIGESAIKRRAGAKDSSQLIPGHGGLLDRFDGMIGGAVFLTIWGLAGLPLPSLGG